MANFGALENLEILSMGRNNIKKLEMLDSVGDVSYSSPIVVVSTHCTNNCWSCGTLTLSAREYA